MPVSQPLPFNVVIIIITTTIIIIIIIIIITFYPILFSFSFSNIILCFDGSCESERERVYRRKIWYQKSNGSLRGKPKLVRLTVEYTGLDFTYVSKDSLEIPQLTVTALFFLTLLLSLSLSLSFSTHLLIRQFPHPLNHISNLY